MISRPAIIGAVVMWLVSTAYPTLLAGEASNPQKLASSFDWSVSGSPNLANKAPSIKVIERFARSMEYSALGESFLGDSGGTHVCSFKFADLRKDGFFSLIVGIGVTERPGCPNVDIIDKAKTRSGFQLFWSGGGPNAGTDISGSIKDLRKNGKLEFLMDNTLGVLPGRCTASWTAIYAWTGTNYTNVSDQFKDFYRQQLDSIVKAIPKVGTESGANGFSRKDKPCLMAEAATIQAFLGMSPDAGIDQMLTFVNSKDPLEREFAADILGSFDTVKSHDYLQQLSNDPIPTVRMYAKNSLSQLSNFLPIRSEDRIE